MERPRVASINVCTDQLLLSFADPDQIVGLSPYSRDPARPWLAARASGFPRLSGGAEDILVLRPDVVVTASFMRRATLDLLKDKGFRVVQFDFAQSIGDVRAQIKIMGDIVGHPDRAAAAIVQLDASIQNTKKFVASRNLRVLPLSRKGWVSGYGSLTDSLLSELGLSNAANFLGGKQSGFAPLETIISAKPDIILLADDGDFAEDQGRAFLLHPALERLYPPDKRIVVPGWMTVCGGPMVADALERLAREIKRIGR